MEGGAPLVVGPHERLGPRAVIDGYGLPPELGTDAGSEGLGHGLLRGEARGEVLVRMRHLHAVGALLLGEDAVEEPVTLAVEHAADALDLHDVGAEADHETTEEKAEVGSGYGRSGP